MTEAPVVRCPGPEGRGCWRMLRITADFCSTCGTTFTGHELYLAYARTVGRA